MTQIIAFAENRDKSYPFGMDEPDNQLRKRVRELMGVTPLATYARRVGLNESTLRAWLIEKPDSSARIDTIAKIAAAEGLPMWRLFADAPLDATAPLPIKRLTPEPPPADGDYVGIPVYDIRYSAGAGALVPGPEGEGPDKVNMYRRDWLSTVTHADPRHLVVVRVTGDSMWETLHDGDHILVDLSQRDPRRDGIYCFRSGDELLVKRVTVDVVGRGRHRLTIASDNPRYDTKRDVDPDDVDIAGRVIWLGRQI